MLLDYEPGDFVINPKNRNWGIGQIQSILKSKVTVNFENIGIPHLAIFWQWYSFPAMAVKGAALATLIASCWAVIHYSLHIINEKIKKYQPFLFQYSAENLMQQIKLGFPVGAQEVISMTGFAIFYTLLYPFGIFIRIIISSERDYQYKI